MFDQPLEGQPFLIVGAGLAGLTAAVGLQQRGAKVTVIEAQPRVGGRVLTMRKAFAEGQHAEAGGDFIDEEQLGTEGWHDNTGWNCVASCDEGFLSSGTPIANVFAYRGNGPGANYPAHWRHGCERIGWQEDVGIVRLHRCSAANLLPDGWMRWTPT